MFSVKQCVVNEGVSVEGSFASITRTRECGATCVTETTGHAKNRGVEPNLVDTKLVLRSVLSLEFCMYGMWCY